MTQTPPAVPHVNNEGSSVARGRTSRLLWTAAGTLVLVIGAIGIVVPLLPTTPLLLLAAACYLRGSARMYNWMLNNRYFGTYLRDYLEKRGIPLKVKIATIAFLWIVIGFSAAFMTDNTAVRAVLLIVALGVSIHVLTLGGR